MRFRTRRGPVVAGGESAGSAAIAAGSADKLPGFDGLRLLGALSVMFSHSYFLATGSEEGEPLMRLLGERNIFGLYGVFTFFIISGFLLTRSLARRPDPLVYAVNRSLRLLPAFVFCTLVTVAVIGPAFTSLPPAQYWSHPGTWDFLRMSLTSLGDMPLPGVFSYEGAWPTHVNGSLWSLRYEALSYIFLLLVWMVLGRSSWVALVILATAVATYFSPAAADLLPGIAYTLPYFAGGVAMYLLHERYGTNRVGALLAATALALAAMTGVLALAFAFFGAYLIVFAGERNNILSKLSARVGDCSYGLYLFGWPAEQMIMQWTETTRPMVLFTLAVPLAAVFAFVSYRLVELPAMNQRKVVVRALSSVVLRGLNAFPRWTSAAGQGARWGFVVAAVVLLTSEERWWYVLPTVFTLVWAPAAVAVLTIAFLSAITLGRGMLMPTGLSNSTSHRPHASLRVRIFKRLASSESKSPGRAVSQVGPSVLQETTGPEAAAGAPDQWPT